MTRLDEWASISWNLFNTIRVLLPDGSSIMELGSGAGTGVLSEFYNMTSIEENKDFLNLYNTTYIYAPLIGGIKPTSRFPQCTTWYDPKAIAGKVPENYDLLLIDGPQGTRAGFWKYKGLFRLDVPIILDDSQTEEVSRLTYLLARSLSIKTVLHLDMNRKKSYAVLLPEKYKSYLSKIYEDYNERN